MKSIFRIARIELGLLFYSPIAWLALLLFTFQTGMVFANLTEHIITFDRLGWAATNFTDILFSRTKPAGAWRVVQDYLYLYIPLLTMGLISREIQSGSIKLLQSSPLTVRVIVLGKYLAMTVYGALLLAVLSLLSITAAICFTNIDMGLVFSGMLGLYLLYCAYLAIGLFLSSLTANQVVAAICTVVVFAVLNAIDKVGQRIDLIRTITHYLRISVHTDHLIDGLIDTRDIFYYLIIVFCFLSMTIQRLQGASSSRSLPVRIGRYILLFGGCLLAGFLTTRRPLTGYLDLTANQTQTLTPVSQAIVRKIRTPLQVHDYVNILSWQAQLGFPEKRNEERKVFEKYERFLPDWTFDYTYYYDTSVNPFLWREYKGKTIRQIAVKQAHMDGFDPDELLSPEAMRARIDLSAEENRFVRQLEANGGKTFLRVYGEASPKDQPMEPQITAALKRLVTSPPVIGFLTGNQERSAFKPGEKNYRYATTQPEVKPSLVNQGFDIMSVELDGKALPHDLAGLVLADPAKSFSDLQLKQLQQYIGAGGNMVILGEPGRQGILNPLLDSLGVHMMEGELMEESRNYEPDVIIAKFSSKAGNCLPAYGRLYQDSALISMPGAAGLHYETNGPFQIVQLVVTNGKTSWNRQGGVLSDTVQAVFDPARGDKRVSLPVALALTRTINGREQRIMVLGDADFISQKELSRDGIDVSNDLLFDGIFNWLTYGEFPPDTRHPNIHHHIRADMSDVLLIRIVFLGLLPALLLISGIMLLLRRRRR